MAMPGSSMFFVKGSTPVTVADCQSMVIQPVFKILEQLEKAAAIKQGANTSAADVVRACAGKIHDATQSPKNEMPDLAASTKLF